MVVEGFGASSTVLHLYISGVHRWEAIRERTRWSFSKATSTHEATMLEVNTQSSHLGHGSVFFALIGLAGL